MTVVLTAACNLRCAYCYQNAKAPRKIDWATLEAAIDVMLKSRRRKVELVFYGGEPLLEFDLIRSAVECVERKRPRHPEVRFAIITNGTLLGEEQAAFLDQHEFGIQLSFDGIREAQALRGPGSFERVEAALEHLRRHHARILDDRLRVAITVLPDTAAHLVDSVGYLVDMGVRDIVLSPLATHAPSWTPDRIDELDAVFARLYRSCLAYYRRTGHIPVRTFRRGRITEAGRAPGAPRSMCGVGRAEHLTVDVDGQVHGCASFAGSFQQFPSPSLLDRVACMKLGSIRSPELTTTMAGYPRTVRQAEIFDDKQDKHSSYGKCRDCRYLDRCRICPMSIGYIEGNDDPSRVPDFACAFTLVTNKYRRRFPRNTDALDVLTGTQQVPELMRELREFVLARQEQEKEARP
jgi:sulfatase maturation enzyme AslB (radical SAM superfamily)